jgi:hypothetical protein
VEVSFRKGVISYGKGGKLSELTSNEKNGFKGITYISLLADACYFFALSILNVNLERIPGE